MTIETQEGPGTPSPLSVDGFTGQIATRGTPAIPEGPRIAALGRTKVQQCTVCGEVFTSTTAGDKHRAIESHYDLIRIDGRLARVDREGGEPVVPAGGILVSVGNQRRRCLTPDEMRDRGMVINAKGRWGFPGREWQPRLEVSP